MIKINEHYLKLQTSYLFSEIANRVKAFAADHPDRPLIKLGIGDVTEPLPPACLEAFRLAVDEMGTHAAFRGYGPEQGYDFLREAIAEHDFVARGATVKPDEVFVSDGAKCDTGNFQEILSADCRIAIPDPVYPVYVDTNVMAGRTGNHHQGRFKNLVYLECSAENQYVPDLPREPVDVIYLCFPNNPTGATATAADLAKWVAYAHDHQALILFDAAYEAFIRDPALPHSIYEIDGAREVAVEFRSFSKTAGFTGTRCAYTVVPATCMAHDDAGNKHALKALWNRRHTTKFNGVSYPVQRAAEAVYSDVGQQQVKALTDGYLVNAAIIRQAIAALGYPHVGGENAPYIWINTGSDSWEFFDRLLHEAGVVVTPGTGFGTCGNGYIRISAFNSRANVEAAMARVSDALKH
ncbi:MAG: LL-diaminopimelate aminotransferase [Verrucomicrobia bacterium]|nr:LL-diaminopimelate aminotransferase [Verrucomicrobiota bacterium]